MSEIKHTCPVWVGRLMVSPLRRLYQNPNKILSPYINPSDKVLEIGPAMGFFSLPIAKIVGSKGMVYCVDVQEQMLQNLTKRAEKSSLNRQISSRPCSFDSLQINDLSNQIDFTLLFAVVHEVENQEVLFKEVFDASKPGAKLLFAEPKGHVKDNDWMNSLTIAETAGFKKLQYYSDIRGSHSILLEKPN